MKDMVEYVKLQFSLAVAYTRLTLSNLAEQWWFPRRKVIAASLSALVATWVSRKLGVDVGLEGQAAISGGAAFIVAWLIPERQS